MLHEKMAPLSYRLARRSDFLPQFRGRDAIAGFFQSRARHLSRFQIREY